MNATNGLAYLAAAGLAISPVAASAGTRAQDAVPSSQLAAVSAPSTSVSRAAAPAGETDELAGPGVILLVLAVLAIIAGIGIAAGGGDNGDVSSGT